MIEQLVVSQRLHNDFDNGKYYYELNGTRLACHNPLLVRPWTICLIVMNFSKSLKEAHQLAIRSLDTSVTDTYISSPNV